MNHMAEDDQQKVLGQVAFFSATIGPVLDARSQSPVLGSGLSQGESAAFKWHERKGLLMLAAE